MGFLDNVKKAANTAREQAGQLAGKHSDKIDQAIAKGGSMVDQRTHGKYSDKIAKAQGAARSAADKVAGESGQPGAPDAQGEAPGPVHTPPPPPPPGGDDVGRGTPPPPPGGDDVGGATPPPAPGAGATPTEPDPGPTAGAGPTPPPPPPQPAGNEAPMSPPVAAASLPSPVREFVAAVNAHDEKGFLDSFGDSGVVDDWGREFAGREAIKGWSDQEFIGAQGTMEVQRVDVQEGHVVVLADWRSNHANGLSEFTFDTTGETVDRMTIRGAH